MFLFLKTNSNNFVTKSFVSIDSIKPFSQQPYGGKPATAISGEIDAGHPSAQASWEGRTIATSKFRLLEFSAFMEVQREEMVNKTTHCLLKSTEIHHVFLFHFAVSASIRSYQWKSIIFRSIARGKFQNHLNFLSC